MFMSDFSLHSIGVFLSRRKQIDALREFLNDVVGELGIKVKRLDEEDLSSLCDVLEEYGLDFDDAYQYASAQKFDLTLVSFDSDFDKTEQGRIVPSKVLAETTEPQR